MRKRKFSNIQKKLAILLLVLYLISMVAAAVGTCTSKDGSIESKSSGESSRNITHDGQGENINAPPVKVKINNATTPALSTVQ